MREALTNKLLVLGMDAMDPRLTVKYVNKGLMPNTKKLIELGSVREDLVMLNGQPTVTPPMWTTMATGAYPVTHGITCFFRQSPTNLAATGYNLDSRNCLAEPFWNVAVEAGKKTLVWHWPGSAWPPTSENPLLHVVDGTQPAMVNMGVGQKEANFMVYAKESIAVTTFHQKVGSNGHIPCVIEDMAVEDDKKGATTIKALAINAEAAETVIMCKEEGEGGNTAYKFDAVLSAVKTAQGWISAPRDAKETSVLFSGGLIRRPVLILKNEQGVYDHLALYKSKKDSEPFVVLQNDVYATDIIDDCIRGDVHFTVTRNMRLLDIKEDGSEFTLWVSAAMDTDCDTLWHPKSLYKAIGENIGYSTSIVTLGNKDKRLIEKVNLATWQHHGQWQANALNYLIAKENYDIVFSHYHFIDTMGHVFFKNKKGSEGITQDDYDYLTELTYVLADQYIGEFLPLIDQGWTLIVVSDHAQVCPEHEPHVIGDLTGVNVPVMRDLGYTVMVKDAAGNDTHEIDWTKTRAIASRGNHIYLNLKSRWPQGIVEPTDQYELEEKMMTDLYGYRDSGTGMRIISLALRNKDAILLGMGGPECGDILFWNAEGYNYDHCDSLSTTFGACDTSVSPIFMAAGPGIKAGFKTERIIRQVDLVPTIAVLTGLRMPKHCGGAPVYQILAEEY